MTETFEAKEKKIGSIRIVKNPNFPSGTSLQAYIKTNRAELRKVFGNPNMGESGDGKSKGKEWNLVVGSHRVTIYDKREKGKKGTKYFNIGGSGKFGALLVAQALSIHRNERVYAKETIPQWLEDKGHHQQVKSIDEHPDLTYQRAKEYGAEYNVEFNEWADQEMNSHGKNISFKDWSKDEGLKHGNTEITEWAQHEDESHDARYGAESNDKTNLTLKELGLLRGIENDSDQWEDTYDEMKGNLYHDEWDMVVYRGVMSSLAKKGIIVVGEPEKVGMGIMANWVFVNPKYTIEDDGHFEINWNLFESKQLKKDLPHMTLEKTLTFLDGVPHAFNPSQKKSAESFSEKHSWIEMPKPDGVLMVNSIWRTKKGWKCEYCHEIKHTSKAKPNKKGCAVGNMDDMEWQAEGKKRSGILSDPFEEASLDSGGMNKVLLGIGLGIIGYFGYNKWK